MSHRNTATPVSRAQTGNFCAVLSQALIKRLTGAAVFLRACSGCAGATEYGYRSNKVCRD